MEYFLNLLIAVLFLSCTKSSSGTATPETDPSIEITDLSQAEGNVNNTFQVQVTLNKATSKTVTVQYTTIDGTAKAGTDFTASSLQNIVFQPNETTKTISIPVQGDDIEEGDERFTIVLSNAVNAGITKASAIVTIRNDDSRVVFNNSGFDIPSAPAGMTLAWSDEFNGNTLDQSSWSFETGNGSGGWGNNELQFYTGRPNNITFQDGKLVIHALAEPYSGFNYTSARIKTQGKKEFKYGRIDIRAILPKGRGVWPALWMLGSNINTVGWPASGEIDIMELLGHEPNKVYGTLHFSNASGHAQSGSSYVSTTSTFNDGFHVFSMEWLQDEIRLYVDNNLIHTITKATLNTTNYPFNQPFFFIFNIAVGGNWPGNPDDTTTFPQWMIVDYVRVYQ